MNIDLRKLGGGNREVPSHIPDVNTNDILKATKEILKRKREKKEYNVFHDSEYTSFSERYRYLCLMLMENKEDSDERKIERVSQMMEKIREAQKRNDPEFMKQTHYSIGKIYSDEFLPKK